MTTEELNQLGEKVRTGLASDEEKAVFLKEANAILEKMNQMIAELNRTAIKE